MSKSVISNFLRVLKCVHFTALFYKLWIKEKKYWQIKNTTKYLFYIPPYDDNNEINKILPTISYSNPQTKYLHTSYLNCTIYWILVIENKKKLKFTFFYFLGESRVFAPKRGRLWNQEQIPEWFMVSEFRSRQQNKS